MEGAMKEKILQAIDKNSKLTAKELAAMLGSTEEEINAAIKQLEDDTVICGYPTLINWDKTESEKVTALIEVKVTPQRGQGFDKIAERIYKFDEVESVYLMSGGFDLTVIIEGKSL
jgi:DNA-binding Lrp family transcriptional regulator